MIPEIPPEVRALPYRDRMKWHERRISRELPVYDFLDSVQQSEKEIWEVTEDLDTVRERIRSLEISIALMQTGRFHSLTINLSQNVAIIKTLGVRNPKRAYHIKVLLAIEAEIRSICEATGEDFEKYHRSKEFPDAR